jgi:hypothetical protein
MEGKKCIIRVFATIMIGAGFLSVMVGAADKPQLGPRVLKVVKWVSFPGDGKVSYEVDPKNGCIQKFFYENGKQIPPERPGWLREGKKTVDFGSFTDSQCRQGVIAIGSSPIEYWGYANGYYYCIGAYDPACPAWYQPCRDQYPGCD